MRRFIVGLIVGIVLGTAAGAAAYRSLYNHDDIYDAVTNLESIIRLWCS